MISFLPGPVQMAPGVLAALASRPVNHRSAEFLSLYASVRDRLLDMTGAAHMAMVMGSGTLANDAIAARLNGHGLVLVNGEFGERLAGHSEGAGLSFEVQREPWGASFAGVPPMISAGQRPDWIWATHCETSTGVLNDLRWLKQLARRTGAKLVLDCVSSVGAVPVDLSDVWLASAVSGKALGAPSGLAMVFGNGLASEADAGAPPVFRLGRRPGNTVNSGLVAALDAALDARSDAHFDATHDAGAMLRQGLRQRGFDLVGDGSAPHVVTLEQPVAGSLAERMRSAGYLLASDSDYLVRRDWLQVCLMGDFRKSDIPNLLRAMERARRTC